MESSIVVDNLTKKYDISKLKKDTQFREALVNFLKRSFFRKDERKEEIFALKNVSFSVDKGEIVGIIGRNGAGKSTLLKILSKITYPTSGKIMIRGKVGSLLEVGTGFHEELTGRENVFLNGSILGMKKKEVKKKLDAIVDFAEVEKFLDTPIKWYSSGMRLKLGFSVAAHLDTDILFIDEVLAVGDVAFQKKCLDTMKDLRNSGRTVIFVSHTMATVESLCPRVLWFDKGELKQDGPVAKVILGYLSQFAKMAPKTRFDLTNIPNRSGSGEIRYTAIEFMTLDGQLKDHIYSGESLKVRLYYQVYQPISKPEFYFNIKTDVGSRVTAFGTSLSGHVIQTLFPGKGYIDLDIDTLNIMPDNYFITMWINTNKKYITDNDINHDGIEGAAAINIEVPESHKHDPLYDKWWGVMFTSCVWNFDGMKNKENAIDIV